MPCSAANLVDFCSDYVGEGGVCTTGPNAAEGRALVIKEFNGAIPVLLSRLDSKGTLWEWKVKVTSQTFTLPFDCLEPRQAWMDNVPLMQRDSFYQGQLGVGMCNAPWQIFGSQMIDMGDGWALPYDWPKHFGTQYALVAEAGADVGKTVRVKYKDQNHDAQEEDVTLLPDQRLSVTAGTVSDVTYINKGQTEGAVRGYIFYPQTGASAWIGTIPAQVSSPSYRKKKIPHCYECPCGSTLVVRGKIRFFPIRSETDEIPICNQLAMAYACKSMYASRNGYYDEVEKALSRAVNELNREMQDAENPSSVSQLQVAAPWGRSFAKGWT